MPKALALQFVSGRNFCKSSILNLRMSAVHYGRPWCHRCCPFPTSGSFSADSVPVASIFLSPASQTHQCVSRGLKMGREPQDRIYTGFTLFGMVLHLEPHRHLVSISILNLHGSQQFTNPYFQNSTEEQTQRLSSIVQRHSFMFRHIFPAIMQPSQGTIEVLPSPTESRRMQSMHYALPHFSLNFSLYRDDCLSKSIL